MLPLSQMSFHSSIAMHTMAFSHLNTYLCLGNGSILIVVRSIKMSIMRCGCEGPSKQIFSKGISLANSNWVIKQ